MDTPFSQKTLDFLFENRLNDSREWFSDHKKEYQALVIQPLRQLVMDLSPTMLELDPEFTTEPKVDKTICRIWRDTRYSKDPSLYRDHMWIIFKRGGRMHGTDYPGMYFEISLDGFDYGCGFYHASTAFMNNLRTRILQSDPEFQAAQEAYLSQKVFHFSQLFSPDLPEMLQRDFRLLFPVYRFLASTAEETLRQETERELWQR